jgi:hypothetical protein
MTPHEQDQSSTVGAGASELVAVEADATAQRRLRLLPTVLTGLLISVSAAALTHLHDGVIIQRNIALQDYTAPAAMGLFLLFALINAIANCVSRRWSLSAAEMAMALVLILASAPLARFTAHGLVGTVGLSPAMVESRHASLSALQRSNSFAALDKRYYLPPDESARYEAVFDPNTPGLAPVTALPWSAWAGPLMSWAPLLAFFISLSVCLGYLLHWQWAKHELVQFPLAEYAAMLTRRSPGRAGPDVFYERSFWSGALAMFLIFGARGIQSHFERMIVIPTKFSYYDLAAMFPFLNYSLEGYSLLRGTVYFSIVAIAFLLPAEISLTAWVLWPAMIGATYLYYTQTGERFTGQDAMMLASGAWWGMAALILWTGRHHYMNLIRAAVTGRSAANHVMALDQVWVARIMLISAAGLTVCLWLVGLPLDVAFLWTIALLLMSIVLCRLVGEMGLPWVPLAVASPVSLLPMALGETVLGAKGLSISAVVGSVLMPYNTTSLPVAPAVCNAAHVDEQGQRGRMLRSATLVGGFCCVALVASIIVLVVLGYSHEGAANDPPRFDAVVKAAGASARLGGDLQTHQSVSERWGKFNPAPGFVAWASVGLVLVLSMGTLRLRFPRFPFHPLPMVLFGSWLLSRFWLAFLLGWFIKAVVIKIGGVTLFAKCRPFFAGIIAGLAMTLVTWMVAHIAVFVANGGVFDPTWWGFMSDMYSS